MEPDDTNHIQPDPPDELLMQRTAAGEKSAFTALVRRHQDSLVNFFRRMGVYTDTEDLVQETFVRLFNGRVRYRPTAKFTTFLYTIARHVWVDLLRKAKRREALVESLRQDCPAEHDGGMRQTVLRMDARQALEQLPEKLRSVVVLSFYQGLRYEEIAAVLEVPVGTVKSRMFNALNQLKEMSDREDAQTG